MWTDLHTFTAINIKIHWAAEPIVDWSRGSLLDIVHSCAVAVSSHTNYVAVEITPHSRTRR